MACYKSLLSRFSVLINYTMWSFNLFTASSCFPHFSRRPDFWKSRFFKVQVFQDPGFSGSRFFRVQVFQGPGFSGSRFFRVRVQGLGPGFRSSPIFVVKDYQWIQKTFGLYLFNRVFTSVLTLLLLKQHTIKAAK